MSSEHKDILESVCRLLGNLPGVRISDFSVADQTTSLRVVVSDGPSMAVLQRLCQGANVCLEPFLRMSQAEREAENLVPVSCSLTASAEAFDVFPHGNLQLLAIHAVWELHRISRLQTNAANELLKQWNAAPTAVG